MEYEDILTSLSEGRLEITINRPEKLNTIREQTAVEILDALERAEQDSTIKVAILQGTARAFCVGIDTSQFVIKANEYFDFYRKRARNRVINKLFRELPDYTKPLITVVEGYALGGGLELALVGDLIIAGKGAKFGLPEARLGLMPGGGGTQTLPRVVGIALAKEMIWTGRRLTAEEALSYRLVNHVVEAGDALEKAREIAEVIGNNAPLSIMFTKELLNKSAELTLREGMKKESDNSFFLYFSQDRQEGLAAFAEKREPKFKGE